MRILWAVLFFSSCIACLVFGWQESTLRMVLVYTAAAFVYLDHGIDEIERYLEAKDGQ